MKMWRHNLLVFVFVALAVSLAGRIVDLAITERDFLKAQGEARSVREDIIPVYRGTIFDRHGEPLAVSTPVLSVWTDPTKYSINADRLPALAAALNVTPQKLARVLERGSGSGTEFVYLKRLINPEVAIAVRDLDIAGVLFRPEYRRFYPAAETSAHVVGMTDVDDVGQEGIELVLDATLKGSAGKKRVLLDLRKQVIKDLEYLKAPDFGSDVTLSLDLRLQFLAYRELKSAIEHNHAKSGSLVMLDVATGDVLALANQPSYNPNNRIDIVLSDLRNRAITDVYEPGSTVKPLAVLAALESGRYTPDTWLDTSPGYFKIGRKLIEDPINRGRLTLTDVLAKSSNVGFAKLALDLPESAIFDTFVRAGVGDPPGTGLPGETLGKLSAMDLHMPLARATLAYGYGLSITPMQLAQSYLTLATGGLRRQVSILQQNKVDPGKRVFSERHVSDVAQMLETVIGEGGTAPKARVSGYRVAGKTGTVRKLLANGYDDGRHVAFFAGFAPVIDPKIVVVVVVNDPLRETTGGGDVAAPVFSRVVTRALRILGVPPEGEYRNRGVTRELAG
jgi:cell division protein FtsI (penicillin-binding protein 3)